MAKIWFKQILRGYRTYSEVPIEWKQAVAALLYRAVKSNELTPERYEEITGEPYVAPAPAEETSASGLADGAQ